MPPARLPFHAILFDAYGTLLDVHSGGLADLAPWLAAAQTPT